MPSTRRSRRDSPPRWWSRPPPTRSAASAWPSSTTRGRGQTLSLSGQGTAPARATLAFFRGRGLDKIPTGPGSDAHLSFTVPGAVDAYLTVLETLGTRSVSEVLAPALSYAEHGFPMYEYMHRLLAIAESRTQFDLYPPGGTAVFYPGGRVPEVGDLFVQPALARTLSRLVEADAGRRGHRTAGIGAARERFYRGDIAAAIGAFSEGLGGLLRADDLAGYRAGLEAPLQTTFAGREILGQAGWTQGPVLLQALGMLEAFDLRAMGHNSVRYIHVVTEALKLAFADRERFYGDSAGAGVPDHRIARARVRARARGPDPHGSRRPRGAGARRSAAPGRHAGGDGRARGDRASRGHPRPRRHDAHRRDRPRRQHDVSHAERRRVQEVGVRPRAGLHAQHAERDVRARGRASECARSRQAAAHHAW